MAETAVCPGGHEPAIRVCANPGAGGGIRTHEGLRHRISRPEADLKYGTTLSGLTCPFDLNPALAV